MKVSEERILLALLPFWTPQIPPMGIACIKTFLNRYGYHVKTVDANVEMELREGYDLYKERLREFIPSEQQGNYSSLVNDVWQNHMMAHIHYEDETAYLKLVKMLVANVFYCNVGDSQVLALNEILEAFYRRLERYFLRLLDQEKPTVVGVSAFIGTLPASLFVLKLTRRIYPHVRAVIGGGAFYDQMGIGTPNLEYFVQRTKDYIDAIFIGEGERLFLKYLQGELPQCQRVFTLQDVGGEVVDLSTVDIPDISDFNLTCYPAVGAYASRSCPFQCNFCSDPVMWGTYRKKSPAQIVGEFARMYEKYGCQLFIMTDLLMNPLIMGLAAELAQSTYSFYFDGPMRVWKEAGHIDNARLWRQAGYYRAEIGCESGSQRILNLMNKKITVEQIKETVSTLAQAGIKTTTYWVIGYPGETEEDFQQTLQLVEELRDDIYEAMNNAFWYHPGGQVHSRGGRERSRLLYPEETKEMLILRHWHLDLELSREERYRRVNRFVAHRKKLCIPDIFSLQELYEADERWKKLHKNAVPPLVEFKREGGYIDENKNIREMKMVRKPMQHDGNWDF